MVKIGLCGIMASGKTTLAEQLIENYSDFTRCSLAGAVKEFANFIFDIPEEIIIFLFKPPKNFKYS